MKTFKTWLTEAISASAADAVGAIIQKYLTKKLGTKVYRYPGVEEFTNSNGRGFGVRYFYGRLNSIRFNWSAANISAINLTSVDVWDGTTRFPNYHLSFETSVSLVKILPSIVDFLNSPKIGTFTAIPADNLNESLLREAADPSQDVFDGVMSKLQPQQPISVTGIISLYKWPGEKLITYLRNSSEWSHLFGKAGRSPVFVGTAEDKAELIKAKSNIMKSIGAVKVTVTVGAQKETYAPTEAEKEIESRGGLQKIAYEEQLQDLRGLIKYLIGGARYALFITGRGGTGKTFTVEEVLGSFGLQDGSGYFKNIGAASAKGIYTALYKNKDSIVFFDEADGALKDQDSRNIFKSATDTKTVRKVSWGTAGKDMYDPAVTDPAEYPEKLPIWFEFTGKIIFISNLTMAKLDPDGALRTRAFIIEIDPSDAEMIDYMEKILPTMKLGNGMELDLAGRKEVFDVIKKSTSKDDVSIRKLVSALNMRAMSGPGDDWKRYAMRYA